jgi:uncharacterized protein YdiU (UPF0061 family)
MLFQFNNSYRNLPSKLFEDCLPTAVANPKLVIFNEKLAKDLGLVLNDISTVEIANFLSGNKNIDDAMPIAQAYAGHQFGHFNMLGDGRAILLGEHITPQNQRFDIQLKGSGETPYSRRGDGRATLSSMLREYLISEAMFALHIPTTRSLAVVATGEEVHREYTHEGAVLTRIASSHIRVGTFEYVRRFTDVDTFKIFTNYTIERHYPHLLNSENYALNFLKEVMEKQIDLIVDWMRVGFIHGVMNTDNMSVCGESIDFGPCAFMNTYHPQTKFSSIDHQGRYAFENQAAIAKWNLSRFAETLLVLIDNNTNKAIELAQGVLNTFNEIFDKKWLQMMRNKLGLIDEKEGDEKIILDLLEWMQVNNADYTNTFVALQNLDNVTDKIYQSSTFESWHHTWQKRTNSSSLEMVKKHNPFIIPRNQMVEKALFSAAHQNDLSLFNELLTATSKPYLYNNALSKFQIAENDNGYKTYCGT